MAIRKRLLEQTLEQVELTNPWIPCPFCSGQINSETDIPIPAVYHTLPACETFLDSKDDALAFVKRCNNKLGLNN